MPGETVFYMRGNFPFPVESLFSTEFVADAKLVLDLPGDKLEAMASELNSFSGFLDQPSLRAIVGSIIANEEHAKSITRLISNMSDLLHSSNHSLDDLLRRLVEWQKNDENARLLSAEDLADLQKCLPIILRRYPCMERQAKAKRLTIATGLGLDEIEIICDLRPVFDENRTNVEGIIPYTILKVVCKGADGLPLSMEAILSEDHVSQLAKKAEAAMAKLKHLKELLTAKEIPIPPVGMTKSGE